MSRISVVIPTYGRRDEPVAAVRALLDAAVRPDEIIVIDQNVPPLAALDDLTGHGVTHIRSATPGYVASLNLGVAHASGDVLLFLDDDIVPREGLVARHRSRYTDEAVRGGLGAVAGRAVIPGVTPPSGDVAIACYRRWTGRVVSHFDGGTPGRADIAPGCNMSILRRAVQEAGGFDPGFDGNGYFAETDLCLTAGELGYRIVFDPAAEILHLQSPSGGCREPDHARHTYYSVKNNTRLFLKHSPRIALPIFVARILAYVFAKAAYRRDRRILTQGLRALARGLSQSSRTRRQGVHDSKSRSAAA